MTAGLLFKQQISVKFAAEAKTGLRLR